MNHVFDVMSKNTEHQIRNIFFYVLYDFFELILYSLG